MLRRILIVIICVLCLWAVAGCSEEPAVMQDAAQSEAPATEIEAPAMPEQEVEVNTVTASAEELYGQIETGMSYEEVMAVMAGHDPFIENEGAIDTPAGQITTQNVSWKIGNHIITAIFQDGKLLGKDLTKIP